MSDYKAEAWGAEFVNGVYVKQVGQSGWFREGGPSGISIVLRQTTESGGAPMWALYSHYGDYSSQLIGYTYSASAFPPSGATWTAANASNSNLVVMVKPTIKCIDPGWCIVV